MESPSPVQRVYASVLALFDPQERQQYFLLIAASIVMGLVDVFSIASIIPFLAVVANPSVIETQPPLAWLAAQSRDDAEFLVVLGIIVFAFVIFGILCRAVTFYAITRFSRMRAYSLATRLFESYLRRDYSWHVQNHSAGLGRTILDEVREVVNGPIAASLRLIANGVVAFLLVLLLIVIEPVAALSAATVLVLGYGLFFLAVRRKVSQLGVVWKDRNAERFQIVQEALGGIREVKVFGLEQSYLDRFRLPALDVAHTIARIATLSELPRYALEGIAFGGMLLFIIFMVSSENGNLAAILPILGAYAFAGVRLLPLIQQSYASYMTCRAGQPMLEAIAKQFDASPDEAEHSVAALTRWQSPPKIALDGIVYRYPGSDIDTLDSLTLTLEAGQTIGLVGATGAGKSTLIDIVLGLLHPDRGTIKLDGASLERRVVSAWRASLGYVPQTTFLIDDTLEANIAFASDPDQIDRNRVRAAARSAQLDDFIATLPNGYSSVIGERGARLSGGQRQRIAIARALYRDPSVLIFDEATSALDNETERAVIDAMIQDDRPRTLVMIAHRLTTLRSCDVIHLIDQGRIAASGDYTTLIETNAQFRALQDAGNAR